MNKRRFTSVLLVAVLTVSLLPALAHGKELWKCTIDLHQGDTGSLEFSREKGQIEGKIIIKRGENIFENTVTGNWNDKAIEFNRALSATSYQPFKGITESVDTEHVKMTGTFAAGFKGNWNSECTLIQSEELKSPDKKPDNRKIVEIKRFMPPKDLIVPAEKGVIIDFIEKAPQAKWTNAWLVLGFPGEPNNSKGFARIIENARLEDGKTYAKVLETHPHWQPRGMITGRYADITIPESGAEVRAIIGFLEGAAASDGVYYEVRSEFPDYSGIPVRKEYYKKYDRYLVQDFSQNLTRFKGLRGTIILSVNAGKKSSTQDWAVWVNPKLVSPEKEYKFASFVGAAIGSGRNGNQLLNAWGGKSGQLYGNVTLYLLFADIDREYSLKINSYQGDTFVGSTDLGTVKTGQTELWQTLQRTTTGEWREQIIFNGTYVGDLRYTISK